MNKKDEKQKVVKSITTITLDPKVKELAHARSEDQKRSLSAHIEFLIEQDLKQAGLLK
jgi:hypothetical protein